MLPGDKPGRLLHVCQGWSVRGVPDVLSGPLCGIDGVGGVLANAANGIAAGSKAKRGSDEDRQEGEFPGIHDKKLQVGCANMKSVENTTMKRTSAEKVQIIACGAIAREIVAICNANGMDHIDLECLPAIWHVHPEKIAPALRQKIAAARAAGYGRIFLGYAECGTQGQIDKICEAEGIERIAGPHCYAFFSGTEKFLGQCEHEFTAFYLTDLITRQFEAFVIEPLKLDKHPELRDMVFGNYTKIVYLAQTEDLELQQKARWAADYLGLAYEYRFTGYGDLEPALRALQAPMNKAG
jgi:hypothetical protein